MTLENDIRIVTTQTQANNEDWPNLAYFHNKNISLGSPIENEKRIVFMGDSITEEWSNLYPSFFSNSSYINRGIGGQTTPQMLLRFKPDTIDLHPHIIILLAGINDVAGNTGPSTVKMITDNIFSMAELAMNKDVKIILSSILPANAFPWNDAIENVSSTIISINSLMKDYALSNGIVYLDYYSSMVDENEGLNSDYTEDGVHPNKEGYKVMSGLAEKTISQI